MYASRGMSGSGKSGEFHVATRAFKAGELGFAAYGRPTELETTLSRRTLTKDPLLGPLFANKMGRFYLPAEAARRLETVLPQIPVARSTDPVPLPGDPAWKWAPIARRWGDEVAASDAIATHRPSWSKLGFASPPDRERSPYRSRKRTDLKSRDSTGRGVIGEVKHLVALSTLEQLDGYLEEARKGHGGLWVGHLIALAAYTTDLAQAVALREDVRLWVCERDSVGTPHLLEIA
jgi:hypothetical protein